MYGTAKDFNQISVGMSRTEVIQVLGQPSSIAASAAGEYLIYRKMDAVISDWPKDYFVKIENGKVSSYGKKGDFNSTKDPTVDINVKKDVTITEHSNHESNNNQSKLDQIEKLYKLKQSGALTEEEYQTQKEVLLKR
jgi:hypothetical protein